MRPGVRTEIFAYGRGNPFNPFTGPIWPRLAAVEGAWVRGYWAASDLGERLGLKANPWRPAGSCGARTPPDLALWPET